MGGYAFFCEFAPIFPSLALRFLLESTLLFCQFLSRCQSLLVIFYITRKKKKFRGPRCKSWSSEFHIILLKKSAQAFFFCRSKYSLVVLAMTSDRASKATMFGMAMRPFLRDLCALFFLFLAGHLGEMPLGLLDHHAGQGEQGDQVGDGHEAVEGVGDGPGQVQLHGRAHKDDH